MIGDYQWIQKTSGKLTFKEKISMLNTLMLPAGLTFLRSKLKYEKTSLSPLKLSEIKVPDTLIVKAALHELEATEHTAIINHSWRTFYWGAVIAAHKQWMYDAESFAIASFMHDLGLVEHSSQYSCSCFTFESALRAESLCAQHQYSPDKTLNVANAICLHMNGYLKETDSSFSKEVLLLQQATACDVTGAEFNRLNSAYRKEVIEHWPRRNFNKEMTMLVSMEAEKNPDSRTALLKKAGMLRMIAMNPFSE